jgi:hypothetical protein
MSTVVENRRCRLNTITQRYDNPLVLDVTSKGPEPWVRFSPFYPHGSIPVPFSPGQVGASVEGIWQALKVFASADVDPAKLRITTMKGIKRSARRFGEVLGHRAGLHGERLLSYGEARRLIYLPCYRWVLENCLQLLVAELRAAASERTVVLLDYETNCDVGDLSRPLSHAGLVCGYVQGDWPGEV